MVVTYGHSNKAEILRRFTTEKNQSPAEAKALLGSLQYDFIIPEEERKELGFSGSDYSWAVKHFERNPHWNGSAQKISDDGTQIEKFAANPGDSRAASINAQRKLIRYFQSSEVQERFSPENFPELTAHGGGFIDEYYQKAAVAQENGKYPELLSEFAARPSVQEGMVDQIAAELERIKALPKTERKTEIEKFLSYDSKSAGGMKDSAIRLPSKSALPPMSWPKGSTIAGSLPSA